jgi:hypothetical protein
MNSRQSKVTLKATLKSNLQGANPKSNLQGANPRTPEKGDNYFRQPEERGQILI